MRGGDFKNNVTVGQEITVETGDRVTERNVFFGN